MDKKQFIQWAKHGGTPNCVLMACADGSSYTLEATVHDEIQAITDDSGHALTFPSLEQAQDFLRKCKVHEAELRLQVAHDEMIGEQAQDGHSVEQSMKLKF